MTVKNSDLWMFFIGSWFGFLLGMIIFNMPTAEAVPADQAQNVCRWLDIEPNDQGVIDAARQLLRQGYDAERTAEIMVSSVAAYCPEHLMVLDRFGQKYA